MEREENVNDELKNIAPGFPEKKPLDPPQGYFENFPDQVLNALKNEKSQPRVTVITWRSVISIAAVLVGLCIGGWWFFSKPAPIQLNAITSDEAYEYIHENISDFEPLIENSDTLLSESQIDVPKEAIDEYLLEEIHGSNPEDLF